MSSRGLSSTRGMLFAGWLAGCRTGAEKAVCVSDSDAADIRPVSDVDRFI